MPKFLVLKTEDYIDGEACGPLQRSATRFPKIHLVPFDPNRKPAKWYTESQAKRIARREKLQLVVY